MGSIKKKLTLWQLDQKKIVIMPAWTGSIRGVELELDVADSDQANLLLDSKVERTTTVQVRLIFASRL